MLPIGWAFGKKCGESLIRVVGPHQTLEVDLLEQGEPSAHVRDVVAARRRKRTRECGGTLGREMLLEVGQGSGFRIGGDRLYQSDRKCILAAD